MKMWNCSYSYSASYLRRHVPLFACVVSAVVLLTACVPKVIRPASRLTVRVNVSPQANKNNPVALDLVLVKNKKLFKELMKIPAGEWFEKRNQYRLDYPKETGLNAGSWEWVPGQVVKIDPMPFKEKYAGGLVFANYFTPGTHRAVIDPTKSIVITLGPEDINVAPEK
jgi:type VI secretion system protein